MLPSDTPIYDSVVKDFGAPSEKPAPPKTPAQIRRAKKRAARIANEALEKS